MSITLTRDHLYELVWSKPRSQIAKDLGISDVAIGKHCSRAHIPAPPKGHWAKHAAGKSTLRLPLPIRLPGHANTVRMGGSPYERHWGGRIDSDAPLVAPSFKEDIEAQVSAALKLVGRVTSTRDLTNASPALARVLAAETARREKLARSDWSFDKPRFEDVVHQRQLRLFDAIAKAVAPVTESVSVFDQDEWAQGHGTVHSLRCHVRFGAASLDLRFAEPSDAKAFTRDRPIKEVRYTTLWLGREASDLGVLSWSDAPDQKLERQLGVIVEALLRRAELALRAHAASAYEQQLEWRAEAQRERDEAARKAELKRLEAIAEHRRRVRQGIVALARQRKEAGDIRELVSALSRHPDLHASTATQFEQWRAQALAIADDLDPLKRPLQDMLASFTGSGSAQ
ncbi:hypothetical protein ACIPRI_25560 [Variovorax sp. LARHSF232]